MKQTRDRKVSFKLQSAEEAAKLANLAAEDRLVLQEIERAHTQGISTKDLKVRTNLQAVELGRVLKKLETRKLVQTVKSVASKNKKMYLLFNLEPTTELTGGSFYSGTDFDHELIRVLSHQSHQYIQRYEKATAKQVWEWIGRSGIVSGPSLKLHDVDQVLQTLVYDAKAEVMQDVGAESVYRLVQKLPSLEDRVESLTSLPPARCDCAACAEAMGQPCAAMSAWLDAVPLPRP